MGATEGELGPTENDQHSRNLPKGDCQLDSVFFSQGKNPTFGDCQNFCFFLLWKKDKKGIVRGIVSISQSPTRIKAG